MFGTDAQARWLAACASDGEFRIASRHWTGGLVLDSPMARLALRLEGGAVVGTDTRAGDAGVIAVRATEEAWAQLLAEKPPRFFNDISLLLGAGSATLEADPVLYAQYYPAVMRAIELLRPAVAARPVSEARPSGAFDSPIGRYVHLDLEGQDYRVYFEEAGQGIPLLLQHTAGCHGAQWRHLFECEAITRRFRLIAYDLPFHGKSLPPVGPKWWADDYKLTAAFLRAFVVKLGSVLSLDRPVFMGCSVGGMLALDLARHHPDAFRAVVSLEGGLHIGGDIAELEMLWHPQVSNDYNARLMNALMSPTSPEAYRKETSPVYASGWPPAFLGDLNYYVTEYDLRDEASKIDTSKVAVHILSGEYDGSGTLEHGQAAHAAIAGSTWSAMSDVGHFPMSENPQAFLQHLLPVLDAIAAA